MTKREFGELEWNIVELFRKHEKMTVRDVQVALGDKDKYTTIMTVMSRLFEKKQLIRDRVGHQYEYRLNPQANQPSSLLEKWKQKIFGGKSSAMINYLIEASEDISEGELEQIEKLIKEIKENRKTSDE